ncbi:hypothetical protein BH24DEI2_BH24DEI2_14530 [soil metagenome]
MNQHPRYQHKLEDLFLHVFVYVDGWLNVNEERFSLPEQASQVASYSELFTIALVGEIMAQPYETVWSRTGKARPVGPSSLAGTAKPP